MEVTYGSGFVFGLECKPRFCTPIHPGLIAFLGTDQVTLSPDLVIQNQGIGVALIQQGFGDGVDGILGSIA
jgi:hypothetical protein